MGAAGVSSPGHPVAAPARPLRGATAGTRAGTAPCRRPPRAWRPRLPAGLRFAGWRGGTGAGIKGQWATRNCRRPSSSVETRTAESRMRDVVEFVARSSRSPALRHNTTPTTCCGMERTCGRAGAAGARAVSPAYTDKSEPRGRTMRPARVIGP